MYCPVCSHRDSKVIDSRIQPDGHAIRRRRECEKCRFRFSTLEEMELFDCVIVKRDGRRESYDREKLASGLRKALEKRPVTDDDFHALINGIECDIQKLRRRELKSDELGKIVIEQLQRFDEVAYIRFASVYRQFKDVETFERELRGLKKMKLVLRKHLKKRNQRRHKKSSK